MLGREKKMSVQLNTYVMYGVLLPFKRNLTDDQNDILEKYQDSAFKPEFNPKDGLTVLDDGMNGRYIAIGHVVAKSANYEGLNAPVILSSTPDYDSEALHSIITVLGFDPVQCNAGWLVISHYR